MKKEEAGDIRRKMALAAAAVGAVLCALTFLFIQAVQSQLWKQSVETIQESTNQGLNTLKTRLRDDFEAMGNTTRHLKNFSSEQREELDGLLENYSRMTPGIGLYLPDGTSLPQNGQKDARVAEALAESDSKNGIIDPHISSVTGVNVFDLFVRVTMKNGEEGCLVREYEVGNIVDSFCLSFYNDAGFSYVINAQGDVLIRPPHPNSNKTVQNLFDMLPEAQNDPEYLSEFARSLQNARSGWAVFNYQGEETVFCYIPLKLQSDWYLISIIPKEVVDAQTNDILAQAFLLIGSILLGIAFLVFFYLRYVNRTNRRLRNQADYIGRLYNAVPEGIALLTVEEPHRLSALNEEGLRLLGDTQEERSLADLVYPEDLSQVAEIFRNTSQQGRKNIFENRLLRTDGSSFWNAGIVEKIKDENGIPALIVAFHDITEEKLAEQAKEKEKLQERITLVGAISNAYPVIVSLNLSRDTLNFIYVKDGLMIELGGQRTYSDLFEDIALTVHPDSIGEFRSRFSLENLVDTLNSEENGVFFEAKQKLADEKWHWISTQIISVDNPYSDDRIAILISRRVDSQRHEEEQRRQALQYALDNAKAANEAKSQFLSNMSHDIRTPMNAIVGMTTIALSHLDDRERVMECLQKITLSSRHLLSLINDILDMSKIENGKLAIHEEIFNFAELVSDVAELLSLEARAHQLEMDVHMEFLQNEQVFGDALRIRQIFINIISNAIKYTPAGGRISVEIKQENSSRRGYQRYIFRCADNGVGMEAEFLEKLFQPFERAREVERDRIAGTGLGMAITKNLVDLMNGDIIAKSTPKEGSVFTVTLPLRVREEHDELSKKWQGIRSLLADDDRQLCGEAAKLLEEMGLRAQFVTDGASAVQKVREAKDTPDPFGFIIVDWKMPDMDGVETVSRIRKEIGTEVPIVVLTSYDWEEIEYEAREAGVTAFMSKPLYRSRVCSLLNSLDEKEGSLPAAEQPDYTGKRILLVEDNELNREIAGMLLEEMGIRTEEAFDGKDAVEKVSGAKEGYYDLIFMDIQMPGMDGYEATRAIRTMEREDVRKLPIVAMTANAFDEDVRSALRSGMDDHLSKPIDMEALKHILHKYLAASSR